MADAKIALALAARALRGFARNAESTRAVRAARELLADLLQQDIEEEPADGGGPMLRQGTSRDRIVSTTDPDMRHGHKSHSKGFEGYKAAAVAEVEHGVILATDVRAANSADGAGARPLVEQAAQRAGSGIGAVFGNTAYGNMTTRQELRECADRVVAKAPPLPHRRGCFSIDDFTIDTKHGVARCPAGKRSMRRDRIVQPHPGWRYVFARNDCSGCALRAQCTTGNLTARMITVTAATRVLQRVRRQQSTPAFRALYRQRVMIEHRLARLCQLGIRQARYFGRPKTAFQLALAAAVANLSLAITHLSPLVLLRWPCLIVLLAVFALPALSMAFTNRRSDFTTYAVAA